MAEKEISTVSQLFGHPSSTVEAIYRKIVEDVSAAVAEKLISERDNKQIVENESDDLMNVAQVANFLGIAKQTVYLKSSNNEIPAMKKGKKLYFSKSDIRSWISSGRRTTNDELKRNLVALKKG